MKKTVIVVLSLALCIGLFGFSKAMAVAKTYNLCGAPFHRSICLCRIHGADAMEDAINMANEEGWR